MLTDTRQYTVGYVPNQGYGNPAPAINLKGRWLEKAGFTRSTPIMVTVVGKHLVITQLPRKALLNDVLPRVKHLSLKAQQELAQIINGLLVQEQAAGYNDRAAKKGVET
ncbi:MAG: SymE family type I addiction module toxin [Enterobacteriaceae bacterium]